MRPNINKVQLGRKEGRGQNPYKGSKVKFKEEHYYQYYLENKKNNPQSH